jgi:hypothetical protein
MAVLLLFAPQAAQAQVTISIACGALGIEARP